MKIDKEAITYNIKNYIITVNKYGKITNFAAIGYPEVFPAQVETGAMTQSKYIKVTALKEFLIKARDYSERNPLPPINFETENTEEFHSTSAQKFYSSSIGPALNLQRENSALLNKERFTVGKRYAIDLTEWIEMLEALEKEIV